MFCSFKISLLLLVAAYFVVVDSENVYRGYNSRTTRNYRPNVQQRQSRPRQSVECINRQPVPNSGYGPPVNGNPNTPVGGAPSSSQGVLGDGFVQGEPITEAEFRCRRCPGECDKKGFCKNVPGEDDFGGFGR